MAAEVVKFTGARPSAYDTYLGPFLFEPYGKAMADRGTVAGYTDGVILIEVVDGPWLRQMMSIQRQLAGEMGRIAGVPVRGIHFKVKDQTMRNSSR